MPAVTVRIRSHDPGCDYGYIRIIIRFNRKPLILFCVMQSQAPAAGSAASAASGASDHHQLSLSWPGIRQSDESEWSSSGLRDCYGSRATRAAAPLLMPTNAHTRTYCCRWKKNAQEKRSCNYLLIDDLSNKRYIRWHIFCKTMIFSLIFALRNQAYVIPTTALFIHSLGVIRSAT